MPSDVPAARQAVRVLTYLAAQAGPSPAAAVAQGLGLPRSTVYHLLSVLVDEGFVTHLPEEHRYGLGTASLALGSASSRPARAPTSPSSTGARCSTSSSSERRAAPRS